MHACWINERLYNMNHCWSAMRCWESMRERKPLRWVANEQPRTARCTLQLNWNTTAEVCRTENKCNIEDNCRVALLLLTVLLNSEQKPGVEMKAVSNNLQLKNVSAFYRSLIEIQKLKCWLLCWCGWLELLMPKIDCKLHITWGLGEVRIIALRHARTIFFTKIKFHRFTNAYL